MVENLSFHSLMLFDVVKIVCSSENTQSWEPNYLTTNNLHFGSVLFTIKIMPRINPWINFNGNAEEACTFYKSVFGGEFAKIVRFKDIASAEFPVAENEANKIMRIALPIGKNILIANDVPEFMGKVSENENRSKISVSAESKEEAEKLFNGLSAGGTIEMPLTENPGGSYFAMLRDKYGIEWMIEFDPRENTL